MIIIIQPKMYFNIELVHLFSGTRSCETNAGTTLRSKGKKCSSSVTMLNSILTVMANAALIFVLLVIHAPAQEIVCSESDSCKIGSKLLPMVVVFLA